MGVFRLDLELDAVTLSQSTDHARTTRWLSKKCKSSSRKYDGKTILPLCYTFLKQESLHEYRAFDAANGRYRSGDAPPSFVAGSGTRRACRPRSRCQGRRRVRLPHAPEHPAAASAKRCLEFPFSQATTHGHRHRPAARYRPRQGSCRPAPRSIRAESCRDWQADECSRWGYSSTRFRARCARHCRS